MVASKPIDYNDFHSLIEIAVNLEKRIDADRHLSTPNSREDKKMWEDRLKTWLQRNYYNPGIIKHLR